MQGSVFYNLSFAALVCIACAIFVSSSKVLLQDRQIFNQTLDRQRNVLVAAGLVSEDERLTSEETIDRFTPIRQVVIDIETGESTAVDPQLFDQRAAELDVATSFAAPPNSAGINRIPFHALVYEVLNEGDELELVVLPVHGLGLWGFLYGFVAIDDDLETVRGLTFYEHKETPGLGGEVDNPRWKSLWVGRVAFDDKLDPVISVVKGVAGAIADDPYAVDGLSGATITSRGVTNLLRFWLGPDGFEPYLMRLRQNKGVG